MGQSFDPEQEMGKEEDKLRRAREVARHSLVTNLPSILLIANSIVDSNIVTLATPESAVAFRFRSDYDGWRAFVVDTRVAVREVEMPECQGWCCAEGCYTQLWWLH